MEEGLALVTTLTLRYQSLLGWLLDSGHTQLQPRGLFVPAPLPTAAPSHTNWHLNVNQVMVAQLCSQRLLRVEAKPRGSPT